MDDPKTLFILGLKVGFWKVSNAEIGNFALSLQNSDPKQLRFLQWYRIVLAPLEIDPFPFLYTGDRPYTIYRLSYFANQTEGNATKIEVKTKASDEWMIYPSNNQVSMMQSVRYIW